jgi:hypothetical protein
VSAVVVSAVVVFLVLERAGVFCCSEPK